MMFLYHIRELVTNLAFCMLVYNYFAFMQKFDKQVIYIWRQYGQMFSLFLLVEIDLREPTLTF